MTSAPTPGSRPQRLGRLLGIALFSTCVAGVTLVFSLQIIQQAFPTRPATTELECRQSVLDLIQALYRARRSAIEEPGEAAAMRVFRDVLSQSLWAQEPAVHTACADEPRAREALQQVQRLRYAEEHAVRYGSRGVAQDRQLVERWRQELSGER